MSRLRPWLRRAKHAALAAPLAAGVCALAHAASSPIGFKPERAEGPEAQTWGVAVLVCILALAALLYLLRRHGPERFRTQLGRLRLGPAAGDGTTTVKVLNSVRLNPQVQLTVVEFGHKRLLLSVSPTSATLLQSTDIDPPPSQEVSP